MIVSWEIKLTLPWVTTEVWFTMHHFPYKCSVQNWKKRKTNFTRISPGIFWQQRNMETMDWPASPAKWIFCWLTLCVAFYQLIQKRRLKSLKVLKDRFTHWRRQLLADACLSVDWEYQCHQWRCHYSIMDTGIAIMLLSTSGLKKAQRDYWTNLQNVSGRSEKHLSEQKRGSRCLWSCTLAVG